METLNAKELFSEEDLKLDPVERAETIPSRWYTDPLFFEFDQKAIFQQTWQYVGHARRPQKPGEYVLATVADNPLLLVRDKEGVLRAFYNVCRHRGGPLVTEDGCGKVLQCRYHGWTYWLNGMLRGVPEFDRVQLFDKKDYGLIPVQVVAWEGMLFVNLAEHPEPFAKQVAGIVERILPNRLSSKIFYRRVTYDIQCNWKVYVDNYLEGYHLPYVHPELSKLLDYRQYITETYETYSLQYSPFQSGDNIYRADNGEAFYYFIFPNFMLNILPGRLQTNLVVPLSQDRTQVIFDYYYDDVESEQAQQIIREDMDYSDLIQQEDIEICEHVQVGLKSRGYDRGRFSVKREQGVYHFQKLLKEAYRRALMAAQS
ncbi:MAG: aromatic ring-hydroxylating dioxygenase subunit alpha [Calditrichaeota bacterium]|nr:MAG: aromatic ring-hydroxylating dioxygenase subunit alpha [Calditrichota bacterium]